MWHPVTDENACYQYRIHVIKTGSHLSTCQPAWEHFSANRNPALGYSVASIAAMDAFITDPGPEVEIMESFVAALQLQIQIQARTLHPFLSLMDAHTTDPEPDRDHGELCGCKVHDHLPAAAGLADV
eukprot:scaffold16008_cov15-Tisochrysis_lutea.AAC.1